MWCNLNSGFWNFVSPKSANEWQLLIRSVLPFIVLPVAGFLLIRRRKLHLPRSAPSRLLMVYGAFSAFAAIFSPEPLFALYWSVAFLATILAAWTFIDRRNSLESARQLLVVTWVATFIVAAIIGYQTRTVVFGDAPTGYGIIRELNGLSRSSGVARWAAVPGLVCIIRAYHSRRFNLIVFYLGIAAISFFIVYRMQSRGAIFGVVAALLFTLLISSRMRRYALPFAALAIVLILIIGSPETVSSRVATYLARGETKEQFISMTGRTRAYELCLAAFQEAPILGRGQWTDRLAVGVYSHNSYLQALLNGGIIGIIPYIASWIYGWVLFYRLQKRAAQISQEDRVLLLEAGTVMMFFTVRSIPETTTASFAVDLLVMVAMYVYLEVLTVSMVRRQIGYPVLTMLGRC